MKTEDMEKLRKKINELFREEMRETEEEAEKPLTPSELRERALSGKTMYYEYDTPKGKLSGLVKTFHSETTGENLLRKRAVFIDGDKAYKGSATPLKLRVGGKYLNRKGEVVNIFCLSSVTTSPFQFLERDGTSYTQSGNYYNGGEESELDLIKEI